MLAQALKPQSQASLSYQMRHEQDYSKLSFVCYAAEDADHKTYTVEYSSLQDFARRSRGILLQAL